MRSTLDLPAVAPPLAKASRRSRAPGTSSLIAPLGVYLALFFIAPVAWLLALSFVGPDGALQLGHYRRLLSQPVYARVLGSTLSISFWVALICTVVAYPVAYVIANARLKARQVMLLLVLLPFWTSFLIRTFAWIVLLGRKGVVNNYLLGLGLTGEPLSLLYNFLGVMIGMTHALLPIAVLTMLPVMLSIDTNLRKAGALLGAGPGQVFWRIYFPLSFPGVAAAWLLVFVSSLGFFITPALLGSSSETMVTQLIIEQVQSLLNWGFAGALSLLLLASASVVFFLFDRIVGVQSLTQSSASSGASARSRSGAVARRLGRLGRAVCWFLGSATDAVLGRLAPARGAARSSAVTSTLVFIVLGGFLVLPILLLVPVSFTNSSFMGWPPEGFSLKWYEEYFHSSTWLRATGRSVVVALASGALSMVLGVAAALALSSARMPGRTAWLMVVLSPFFIPRIVVAVALFYLFANLRLLDSTIGLILGHTVLGVPYVVITVMAILNTYDHRLNQAAWTLGASRWQALRRITLPIIKPGLFSAFLFAFVTSFDDVTLALFLSAGTNTTLPKQMWADATMQVSPLLAAVSTIVLVVVTALILLAEAMRAKAGSLASGR
jgi:putative spermidine/putrescine transport system permease protein